MARRGWRAAFGAVMSFLVLAGCAGPSASPWREPVPVAAPATTLDPVFCYRTLAEVSCYFARDPTVPGQLVAVYPRPVSDPLSASFWRRAAALGPVPETTADAQAQPETHP